MSNKEVFLDFNNEFQEAIIGHMISDYTFFLRCVMQLKNTWFRSPITAELFDISRKFYEVNKRHFISLSEIKSEIQKAHPIISDAKPYLTHLDLCVLSSKNIGLDVMSKDMTDWIKVTKFEQAVLVSTAEHNRKNYAEARKIITNEIKELQQCGFEDDGLNRYNQLICDIENSKEQYKDCLTIGHPLFDEILLEGSMKRNPFDGSTMAKRPAGELYAEMTTGSLVKGDTTMILGPSNSGKTTSVISIIVANLYCGRDILHITHEMAPEIIKMKLVQCFVRMTRAELMNRKRTSNPNLDYTSTLDNVGKQIDNLLTYRSWIKGGGMYVEDVIAWINLRQEQLKARKGKGYDLLVVDYPGKLISGRHGKNHSNWEQLDYVYDQFVNLALEHKFHALLPVQTNREGFRVNNGDSENSRLLDQGDVGGSFGVMQRASTVITLNRNPSYQQHEIMMFNVAKSRNGSTNCIFATATDFARGCSHGIHLPATTLTPTQVMSTDHVKLSQSLRGNSISKPASSVRFPVEQDSDKEETLTAQQKIDAFNEKVKQDEEKLREEILKNKNSVL